MYAWNARSIVTGSSSLRDACVHLSLSPNRRRPRPGPPRPRVDRRHRPRALRSHHVFRLAPHVRRPTSGPDVAIAAAITLAVAILLRRTNILPNLGFVLWVAVLPFLSESLARDVWFALGAVALAAWGIADRRVERINLGVVGFALTVLYFYFSSLLDLLGRSASLAGLGILFLAGGWALERVRRRLVARIGETG